MFEKSQVTCNCFGATTSSQQKFFLARKRQPQESESLQSSRRVIKSTEMKSELDGKGQKKSLKKRASSFVHSGNHNPNSAQLIKQQSQIKPNILEEPNSHRKNSWTKTAQTPSYLSNNPFVFNISQTPNAIRQPAISSNQKQFPYMKKDNLIVLNSKPFNSQLPQPQRNNIQLRPQLLQFSKQTNIFQQKQIYQLKQQPVEKIPKQDSRPSVSAHQITFREPSLNLTPYQSQKCIKKETEKWASVQGPLLIQNFQKLFSDKEESKSIKYLVNENKVVKPREAQISKRFQQQQLMGRFAESQDQECSQAPQSEVIGKGFDRTYQELLEVEEPNLGSQTKASRSTNTKVSNLKLQKNFIQHQRIKFRNVAHFTSYDRL